MFVINSLGIIFRFIVKFFFDFFFFFFFFFVMYSSTWNVNLLKFQIHFMFINIDVQCNSTLYIIIMTT
jgi:hypothetical protein